MWSSVLGNVTADIPANEGPCRSEQPPAEL